MLKSKRNGNAIQCKCRSITFVEKNNNNEDEIQFYQIIHIKKMIQNDKKEKIIIIIRFS